VFVLYCRLENRDSRHCKFLRAMLGKLLDCVPPIIIYGHQFTMASNHQHAASKYLEAYKLLPENPLINLCVGKTFYFSLFLVEYLHIYAFFILLVKLNVKHNIMLFYLQELP
jgi:hypothetical protein